MINKSITYTFRGATQDVSKSKHPVEYYFEGRHIKLLSTDSQSSGSVTNEKGNELVVTIPDININTSTSIITYGTKTLSYVNGNEIDQQINSGLLNVNSSNPIIIGHTITRDGIVLFTTDDNGMDCIWLVNNILEDDYSLDLLYLRNLNFSINNPIQAIFNYENENIQKVYWVDGINQIRYINITHSSIEDNKPLIEVPLNSINFVGNISFSQPTIVDTQSGGSHTSGMIQYAYNLFILNGSQTKISPLSELISLDKGDSLGGGDVNEVVGSTPIINIANIDTSYTNINIYAIKYTSYNQIPSISLIDEREINNITNITLYDDGSVISSLSLEEFLFLGSNPTIPKHIESKDNRLFLANLQDNSFDIPKTLDFRAYSFPINSIETTIWKDPQLNNAGNINKTINKTPVNSTYNIPYTHDSINLDYDNLKYQYNSSIIGGTGKYLKYELVQKTSVQLSKISKSVNEYRFLKDEEIYRIGIQLYNNLGQLSPPKWIADFKTPKGNLQGNYNTLKVTLLPEFYTWLNTYNFNSDSDKPVGYKIVRADRTLNDMTILCQGSLNGMMSNTSDNVGNSSNDFLTALTKVKYIAGNKLPSLQRVYDDSVFPMMGMLDGRKLDPNNTSNANPNGSCTSSGTACREVIKAASSDDWRSDTFQFNKLIQLHTPEILFSTVSLTNGLKLKIVGAYNSNQNYYWGKEIRNTSLEVHREGKTVGAISPHANSATNTNLNGSAKDLLDSGLFGPCRDDKSMEFNQFFRDFTGTFYPSINKVILDIYGSPEFTERGQGLTYYNNNPDLSYYNSLEPMLTDQHKESAGAGTSGANAITSVNSFGSRCITIVEGSDNASTSLDNRKSLETIFNLTGITSKNVILISELVIPETQIYLGNIYGGNTYESKSRTNYIEIGEYKDILIDTSEILSAGDTYVQDFKFLKIGKTDVEIHDNQSAQYSEIIQYKVETTIDLKNRNDLSLVSWESRFQPRYEEYFKYNRVYSQSPNLVSNNSIDFTFKKIKNFDTRIQSTKLKIPNESVDSWTDVLENEVMDLDGKYGPITSINIFKDRMISFQDEAISNISINPKVQVQSNDGISIELGRGDILYDYDYLTTKSGSINKWGIIQTKKGIYYYDALNKAIGRVPDAISPMLTDIKGMHSFFNNNYYYDYIKVDNPLINKGVVFGYDNYNNDVYFSLLQNDKSFTWCYNEIKDEFIDLKSYIPSRYISKGEKFLIPDTVNNKLYEQYKGDYNKFFGQYEPSYIILQLNPEANIDCVFNNIHYNSELYLNDIDQPDKTLTHIQAYNEYQDSGRIPLIVGRGSNIRRKFREWQADIPRTNRNRIRNPWIFLKLELDNQSNYKLILHDISIFYST